MDKHGPFVFGATLAVGLLLGYFIRWKRNRRKLIAKEPQLSTSKKEEPPMSPTLDDENSLTSTQANFLKSMLESQDTNTLNNALITIGNMAAFTDNQILFRECGCLHTLVSFVLNQDAMLVGGGSTLPFEVLDNALLCINNLCLNEENQFIIKDVIPATYQILQRQTIPPTTKSICMMVLANFSILENFNEVFDPFVPEIVNKIFNQEQTVSALRILINLSSFGSGRTILECKIPNYLSFSPINHPFLQGEDVFIRWLTLLSHLSNLFSKECGTPSKVQKDINVVDSESKIRFKSLFLDNQRRDAMKQDLKLYLDKNSLRKSKRELCDIVEYLRAKIYMMDIILKELNIV